MHIQRIILFLQRETFKYRTKMKKLTVLLLGILLLTTSSCGTYTATGAYTGAQFGSIIGSAVGGISGGWRGHEVGKLIGLAGGAAVGAAVGAAADNAAENRYNEERAAARNRNVTPRRGVNTRQDVDDRYGYDDDSGFDPTGSGDDRIMLDGMSQGYTSGPAKLEIRNAHFSDISRDGILARGEAAHVVFEIYNSSDKPVYSILPSVREVTGNKHIHVSENILVESIGPRQAIRYTAQVKADNRLKDGEAVICVSVFQAGREISSQTRNFRVVTKKR